MLISRCTIGPYKTYGFTLIELIAIIVILSTISIIGASFVSNTIAMYSDNKARSTLVQHGRLVIEQLSRTLRTAAPHSVRVSSSGNCLEFLPILGGASYTTILPDDENNAAMVSSIAVVPFSVNNGTATSVIVSPLSTSDIYTSATISARATLSSLGASPVSALALASPKRFIRNSLSQRLFVVSDPIRYCLNNNDLYRYSDYGFLTSTLSDGDPGGTSILMATAVSSTGAFALSGGSEDRNTAIDIRLDFADSTQSLMLEHRVLIRNVP